MPKLRGGKLEGDPTNVNPYIWDNDLLQTIFNFQPLKDLANLVLHVRTPGFVPPPNHDLKIFLWISIIPGAPWLRGDLPEVPREALRPVGVGERLLSTS